MGPSRARWGAAIALVTILAISTSTVPARSSSLVSTAPSAHQSVAMPDSGSRSSTDSGADTASDPMGAATYLGSVGYTLVGANGTLLQGDQTPPVPSAPSGAAYDPLEGLVFMGDSQGSSIFGLNGSTGLIEETIPAAWSPAELAFDPSDGSLLAATGGGIVQVNPQNRSIVQVVHGNAGTAAGGSEGLAYDRSNGLAYAVDFTDDLVLVVNVTDGRFVTNLSIPGGPQTLAYDPVDQRLFVGSSWGSSVTVVDTRNNTIAAGPIGLGTFGGAFPYPNGMVYDPANGYVYVCSNDPFSTNTIVLAAHNESLLTSNLSTGACLSMGYDPANGHVYVGGFAGSLADINGTSLAATYIRDPYGPAGMAYDSRDGRMYAANSGDRSLTVFNATTEAVVEPHLPLVDTFLRSTYDPLNGETYVANPDPGFACAEPGTLTVVNTSTHPGIAARIPVGFGPEASVVATDSGSVFVANSCSDNVTVVDGATETALLPGVPVGSYPVALGYDPVRDEVWVANGYSNNLTVLNGSTGAVVMPSVALPFISGGNNTTLPQQPDGVAVDPTDGRVYVADYATGNVTVLSSANGSVIDAGISTGSFPEAVLYDSAGGTILVANSGSDTVTVLNASTGAVIVPSIPAGVGPVAMALDSIDQLLYVADAAGGTVTIIDLATDSTIGSPVAVNSDPQGVSFDPATDQVDVSDFLAGTISVLADVPVVRSFAANPVGLEAGRTAVLSVDASESGGSVSDYAYSGLPPGCPSSNASTLVCSPGMAGSFRVTVTATDSRGYAGWAPLTLPVATHLAIANLSVAPSPSEAGSNLTIAIQVAGGVAPFTYYYSGLPPGCGGANVSTLTCTPSVAGVYRVAALVSDALGVIAVASTNLTVTSPPPPPPLRIVSFSPTQPTVEVNSSVTFSAVVAGGSAPVTIRYTGLPPGCVSVDLANLTCSPTIAGVYLVTLVASDAVGDSTSASTLLTVSNPTPPLAVALFAATPNPWTDGQTVVFQVVATGGTPPLKYSYGGLPGGCVSADSPRLSCNPSGPHATAEVRVLVTDALGLGAQASLNLSWTGGGATQVPPGPPGGLSQLEWAAGIALGVAAGVVAVLGSMWIRRRLGRQGR